MLTWVWVYLGIALAGLVMVACFAVWLWRKAMVLLDEAGVLLQRADQLAGILEQIGQPQDFDASQTSHRFGTRMSPAAGPTRSALPGKERRRMADDLRQN